MVPPFTVGSEINASDSDCAEFLVVPCAFMGHLDFPLVSCMIHSAADTTSDQYHQWCVRVFSQDGKSSSSQDQHTTKRKYPPLWSGAANGTVSGSDSTVQKICMHNPSYPFIPLSLLLIIA